MNYIPNNIFKSFKKDENKNVYQIIFQIWCYAEEDYLSRAVVRSQEGSRNEVNRENDEEAGFLDDRRQIPSPNEIQSNFFYKLSSTTFVTKSIKGFQQGKPISILIICCLKVVFSCHTIDYLIFIIHVLHLF